MKKIISLSLCMLMIISALSAMSMTAFADGETAVNSINVNYICEPEDKAPVVDFIVPEDREVFTVEAIRWYELTGSGKEHRLYDEDVFSSGDNYRVYVDVKLNEGYITEFYGFQAEINGVSCDWTDMQDYSVTLYRDFTATAAKEHSYDDWITVSLPGAYSDGVWYRMDQNDPDSNYYEYRFVSGYWGNFEFLNTDKSDDAYYYTGKVITPKLRVYDGKENYLTKDKDYKLSFSSGRKNVGTYKVKISFIGNYGGSASYTFRIVKAPQKMSVTGKTVSVKHTTLKKKNVTVTALAVKNSHGAKTYKKLSGNKKITVNATTGKFTVKKGLKKGTYKVKVKVTAKGTTNYQSAAKTATATIKVK